MAFDPTYSILKSDLSEVLHSQPVIEGKQVTVEQYRSRLIQEEESSLEALRLGNAWRIPPGLEAKVSSGGKLSPFFGDTIIFPLSAESTQLLTELQSKLYLSCPGFFAERLDPSQFHLTLHDLSNGPSAVALAEKLEQNEQRCRALFEFLAASLEKGEIKMQSLRLYPCVATSVVLGFAPDHSSDLRLLLNCYRVFDSVQTLPYWLRPHVTLAYFGLTEFSPAQQRQLHEVLRELSKKPIPLVLDLWQLCYCHFVDMNNYQAVCSISDFR